MDTCEGRGHFPAIVNNDVIGYLAVYCVILVFSFRNREISVALNINMRIYFKFAGNHDSLACHCVVQHALSSRAAWMTRLNNNYKNKILSNI